MIICVGSLFFCWCIFISCCNNDKNNKILVHQMNQPQRTVENIITLGWLVIVCIFFLFLEYVIIIGYGQFNIYRYFSFLVNFLFFFLFTNRKKVVEKMDFSSFRTVLFFFIIKQDKST